VHPADQGDGGDAEAVTRLTGVSDVGDLRVEVEGRARAVLDAHWDGTRGWSVPNAHTYPHLWLWDSCFHSIVWAHLSDDRATAELSAALDGQLSDGLVPHMRYGAHGPDTFLGPLAASSSLAQPPMYGHAIRVLHERGVDVPDTVLTRARRGLRWLLEHRRRPDTGLLYVVHPWEVGNDHSPRWDDWGAPGGGPGTYDREARTAWNKELMGDVTFAADGAAVWCKRFVVCSAAFNAYVAFNLAELASVTGDDDLRLAAAEVAAAMDRHLWSEEEHLWADLAVVGGGPSVAVPISDGAMGALVTADPRRAVAALTQLDDPARFGAPYGPSNLVRTDALYVPDGYWRGAAWPSLSYLFWCAQRRWARGTQAADLALTSRRAALRSGWAEYWNPETAEGLGATPQSWTGLVIAMEEPSSADNTAEAMHA
jgi:hypothetical protein